MRKFKKILKQFIPPILIDFLQKDRNISYSGNYRTWEDAVNHSYGYDSDAIIGKVTASTSAVVNGEAAYERDGVLFYEQEYNWPLLAALYRAAAECNNKLNILDFGGALGSSYFQHKPMLGNLDNLHWNIIEQEKFVKIGREKFQTNELRFFDTIDSCLSEGPIDLVLLSSVLPYIQKPWQLLEELISHNFRYIVIDKMPLLPGSGPDRLVVQKVPEAIYKASYPAWILRKKNIEKFLLQDYNMLVKFQSYDKVIKTNNPVETIEFSGYIWIRRENISHTDKNNVSSNPTYDL